MRVRCNFTFEVDVEEYREKTGQDINKTVVRQDIQEQCVEAVIEKFAAYGLKLKFLGRNNAYDAKSRQTVHEDYIDV